MSTQLSLFLCVLAAFPLSAQEKVNQGALVLQDFDKRIAAYLKLHREASGHLPALKHTGTSAEISHRETALAAKIREARSSASQGEIFTPEIAAQFRLLIGETMRGPSARRIRESLRQATPVWLSTIKVNMTYPRNVPLQTSPPTLLMNLPQLPPELEYRFVDHTLILRDREANLVVDFMRDAIP